MDIPTKNVGVCDCKAYSVGQNGLDGALRIATPKTEALKGQKVKIGDAKVGWWDKLLGKKEEPKKVEPAKSAG